MSKFQPELGQPYKEYKVPKIWESALLLIDTELCRVMWNIHQEKYESPFENTGVRFDGCPEFYVEAYMWNVDVEQPYNFKWRDVEISWYKHFRRGLSANKQLTPEQAANMLDECLEGLSKYEKLTRFY